MRIKFNEMTMNEVVNNIYRWQDKPEYSAKTLENYLTSDIEFLKLYNEFVASNYERTLLPFAKKADKLTDLEVKSFKKYKEEQGGGDIEVVEFLHTIVPCSREDFKKYCIRHNLNPADFEEENGRSTVFGTLYIYHYMK